jgi:uncharacterized oxidoreductase
MNSLIIDDFNKMICRYDERKESHVENGFTQYEVRSTVSHTGGNREITMQMTGNTILITGGGSGIGRALAEAFHARGNQVVIAGRRQATLNEVTKANEGMASVTLDIEDAEAIKAFAEEIKVDFPALNVVIHNAGIMRRESLQTGALEDAEAIVATNLLGPLRLNAALLPFLLKQPSGAILTVSSGLAFMPAAPTATYCATKAAIHSYTQSLRYQLKNSRVQVVELVPPYVQTELLGPHQAVDPQAMPLKDFIDETMSILTNSPEAEEVCVERVALFRYAEAKGTYDSVYKQFNEQISARAH